MLNIVFCLIISLIFISPAQAQNCTDPSRCEKLGFTQNATDCQGYDILKCPFNLEKLYCIAYEAPEEDKKPQNTTKTCAIGDILYSDKKCYKRKPLIKQPIAVVFDIQRRLAVAFNERMLEWGDAGWQGGCLKENEGSCIASGKENTEFLLKRGAENNEEMPSAEYCNEYTTEGTKTGEWFLPSVIELQSLSKNFSKINSVLTSLGKTNIANDDYWSSSKHWDNFKAWRVNPSSGHAGDSMDGYEKRVRPVIQY